MIDIHNHILSSIDDGAKTIEMSTEMAEQALANGIDKVIATPHHLKGSFINSGERVKQEVDKLNHHLYANGVNIKIYPGQEVRLHAELLTGLKEGSVLPLAGSHYVLIELPTNQIPLYTETLFFELKLAGYTPIIAHPERNIPMINDLSILEGFIESECLAQLTWGSFNGNFGRKIAKASKEMIKNDLVQFIATDTHNTTNRSFLLPQKKMAKPKWRDALQTLISNSEYILTDAPFIW